MLARAWQRGGDRIGRFRRSLGEETLDTTAEVEDSSGDEGAQALKEQEARTGIDICMGLTLEREAERNKKREGEESQLKSTSHGASLEWGDTELNVKTFEVLFA
jgi:hypothetical protein